MPTSPYTYDPKDVAVIVGGVPLSGFADGTMINVDRTGDAYMKHAGTDGTISRAKNADKSGTISITLAQTSPSNDVLQGIARLDEISKDGIVPVLIQDFSGRSIFVSAFAWVKKVPAAEFGKEVGNREWVLDCADLDMNHGGNTGVS